MDTVVIGLPSLVDAFPYQHPDAPEASVSIPVSERLFGQGVEARFEDLVVTIDEDKADRGDWAGSMRWTKPNPTVRGPQDRRCFVCAIEERLEAAPQQRWIHSGPIAHSMRRPATCFNVVRRANSIAILHVGRPVVIFNRCGAVRPSWNRRFVNSREDFEEVGGRRLLMTAPRMRSQSVSAVTRRAGDPVEKFAMP
jgi:hypothetical protein